MTATEKKAYQNGVTDKMTGETRAIKICKTRAATGDKNCAAYVRGYENSGVGE